MHRKTVVIGMLGSTLDQHGGLGQGRWEYWRPTVALGMHEDLLVSRLDLLHSAAHKRLALQVKRDLAQVSPETKVQLHLFELADPWDFEEVYAALYDFAAAYPFDTDQEDYLVHISTGTHVLQICLFLLTESRHIPARLLQTAPAPQRRDPAGQYVIIDLDLSRYDRLAARFRERAAVDASFLKSGIDTQNAAFNAMIARIEKVGATSTAPILLTGPTGAGKSRLARLIYELRRDRHLVAGDFVAVNCATLRGDAALSALFGHRRGAFTGAESDRSGLLCAADGGLLFLDEVGELGLDEQAMLLRAIEEKRFYPLGADAEQHSDFQLICGTNQDLEALAAAGRFREDLLLRINLWRFHLPGLAERPEDIEPNLDYELDQFAGKSGNRAQFNHEARELFLTLATGPEAVWRGNFRDLSAAVMRMGTLADGGRIDAALVREEWARLRENWQRLARHGALAGSGAADRNKEDATLLQEVMGEAAAELDLFDAASLACVIRECRVAKNLSEAGRRLFAQSRQHRRHTNDADRLRKYLFRFGLSWETVRKA